MNMLDYNSGFDGALSTHAITNDMRCHIFQLKLSIFHELLND